MLGHLVPCGKVMLEWILKTFYAVEDSWVSDHDRVAFYGCCLMTTRSIMMRKGKWRVLIKFYDVNTSASFQPFSISVRASNSLHNWNAYLIFMIILIWLYYMEVNSALALFFLLLHFDNESFVKMKWFIVSPDLLLSSQPLPESSKIASAELEVVTLLYEFIHF